MTTSPLFSVFQPRSLKTKVLVAILFIGLIPMLVIGTLACRSAYQAQSDRAANRMELMAVDVADKIDRSLFERFCDVQAFAINPMAQESPEQATIAANFYTTAYGCYDLMMITNANGKVVACNTVGFDGKPIDTSDLVGKSVIGEQWYEECVRGRVTQGQSYTSDVTEDDDTASVYRNRALTMNFSAPIRNADGEIVGVWSNRASAGRIVAEVTSEHEATQRDSGMTVSVDVLSRDGLLLNDSDTSVNLNLNLVEEGVDAAFLGSQGLAGATEEVDSLTGSTLVNGYAQSKGYGQYKGHEWVVLSRWETKEAFAAATSLRNVILMLIVLSTAATLAAGEWLARGIVKPIRETKEYLDTLAKDEFSSRLKVQSNDEFQRMVVSLNRALENTMEAAAKIQAIGRTSAVIEFEMDGTIIDANEIFLNCLGYSIEEIKGRNHSMFADEDLRNSLEYRDFWERLNAGENLPGEYRRIGKGGKEVYILASYNPIRDTRGKLTKVVKFASDVTATVLARQEAARVHQKNSARDQQRAEEMARVLRQVNMNASTLASAAEELTDVSSKMATNANETSGQAGVVSAASEQVSQNVHTVSTGVEGMTLAIREIARSATDAARVSNEAVSTAAVANTSVSKLGDSSLEIGKVIKVITSIAEQTNLLALNATIEAARAGEAGKGFAVVANEVKELAKETAKATEDISCKIEAIQGDTQGAVDSIREIGDVIAQINYISNTIASAVEEQTATANEMSRNVAEAAKGTSEIAQNITSVAMAAQSITEGATNCQQAAGEMSRMAVELQELRSLEPGAKSEEAGLRMLEEIISISESGQAMTV